ncbi:6-phosphogluconolactonase [Marinitoga sp. 1155]|nr:6-phosphogluconolactonase [Marinitoga sp. 1155]
MEKIMIFEYNNLNDMSFDAAKTVYNFYTYYIKKQNFFTFVLSGGNTPKILYQILASQYSESINWNKVYIFFGDERYIDIDSEYSNYKMAYNNILSMINIPAENIYRIKTEITPIERCADEYENSIKIFFRDKSKDVSFDLVLLGLGADGHIASIFPDIKISDDKYIDYVFPEKANPNIPRITFTYKSINNSKNVLFLLSGDRKIKVLKEVFKGKEYPAKYIKPKENLLYFISK